MSLTLPQEPHVKDAATEAVAKEQNKTGVKEAMQGQGGRGSGVLRDARATDGWAVARRKKRPQKQKALPPVSEEKAEVQAALGASKKATPAPCKN